jgi:peptidoglycan/xylan/chitin deacetylase (PgdA/CDA1 family)
MFKSTIVSHSVLRRDGSLLLLCLVVLLLTSCQLQPLASGQTAADTARQPSSDTAAGMTSAPEQGSGTTFAAETVPVPEPAASEPAATEYDGPPSAEHPVIALTFDDGPSVDLTGTLLDTLRDKKVPVTFFVLGGSLTKNREDLLRREVAEGHEIGNHTYSHQILKKADAAATRDELVRTNDKIAAIAGITPTIMRPPTGAYSTVTESIAAELGLVIVNWSWQSCPEDWNHKKDPDYIASYVIDHAANGHILLLHDTNPATVTAVPAIIDGLRARGFRFMTVSDLLAASSAGRPAAGTVVSRVS